MTASNAASTAAAPWLLNAWYVAAWSSELGEQPLGRTLLDRPVVFWRRPEGGVAAIGGRCPHRFAPLAAGKQVGDSIECPYHGLRFDASGACSFNPHGEGAIPRAARVPAYPVLERHRLVWFWPGDPQRADPALVPELPHLDRDDLGHVTGTMGVDAHYELYVDNLMDLTHAQFVHGEFVGSGAFSSAEQSVEQEGARIVNRIAIAASDVPPMYRAHLPADVEHVYYWMDSFWHPPSIVTNWVGVTVPGRSREAGLYSHGTHIVTPASRHASHYFFGNSRNLQVGDAEVDAKFREWQRVGFGLQDKPIIEACARLMGDVVDPLSLRAVLLPSDAAAVRVRRTLARLRQEEASSAALSP
ncbi:aromatic ring-hydroxylating dioxygenase subunit alpha [Ramlibacter sp. AW1]|uniref:Aromatic ring-hydroxylating dioxygenase subunit alpha n=1 Tax=Ramlibacter aurantiacus TaxID=2801330 RepID=A0A936ZQC9_9BURK|nr:aromatic ring-hydroxylating dioxygenase subunit alpha [Ramlibacter aurantiacus]MBL0421786.1 aromatic ring-hydroxylating dioxygenase subunit alpha [Ramlibacter aurantiacus]